MKFVPPEGSLYFSFTIDGGCYCTSPNQDEKTIKQMVSEFQANSVAVMRKLI